MSLIKNKPKVAVDSFFVGITYVFIEINENPQNQNLNKCFYFVL